MNKDRDTTKFIKLFCFSEMKLILKYGIIAFEIQYLWYFPVLRTGLFKLNQIRVFKLIILIEEIGKTRITALKIGMGNGML